MGGIIFETIREMIKRERNYKDNCKKDYTNIDDFLSEEFDKNN